MPKISREESLARRDQVIDACAELYRTQGYHDITMAQIAEGVSFGRANIYNYFQNKDEVFLALLRRENERWAVDLAALENEVTSNPSSFGDAALAQALAATLERRIPMLKLLATSIFDMEQFSRHEKLVELKVAYGATLAALRSLLHAAKPAWDEARIERFVILFMPYLHGVYPYAFHSDKQLAAMRDAGVPEPGFGVADMVGTCALKLLQED